MRVLNRCIKHLICTQRDFVLSTNILCKMLTKKQFNIIAMYVSNSDGIISQNITIELTDTLSLPVQVGNKLFIPIMNAIYGEKYDSSL